MYQQLIYTPIGPMLAKIADEYLISLQFVEKGFTLSSTTEISTLGKELQAQLDAYFAKKLTQFDMPIQLNGSDFQKKVWLSLSEITYGQTMSYQSQALKIHQPKACRAVANANAKNPILILQGCHRIIRQNGELGGYRAGMERKHYLLSLEGGGVKKHID